MDNQITDLMKTVINDTLCRHCQIKWSRLGFLLHVNKVDDTVAMTHKQLFPKATGNLHFSVYTREGFWTRGHPAVWRDGGGGSVCVPHMSYQSDGSDIGGKSTSPVKCGLTRGWSRRHAVCHSQWLITSLTDPVVSDWRGWGGRKAPD